jgi:hypothetical protein
MTWSPSIASTVRLTQCVAAGGSSAPVPTQPDLRFALSPHGSRNIFGGDLIGIEIHPTKGWGRSFSGHMTSARAQGRVDPSTRQDSARYSACRISCDALLPLCGRAGSRTACGLSSGHPAALTMSTRDAMQGIGRSESKARCAPQPTKTNPQTFKPRTLEPGVGVSGRKSRVVVQASPE